MPAAKKHTQHAPYTKTKCNYLYGRIQNNYQKKKKKKPHTTKNKKTQNNNNNNKTVTYAQISPKMVNPRNRTGTAEEEHHFPNGAFCWSS